MIGDRLGQIAAVDNRYAPATDDRYANFSASTCPTQSFKLTVSSIADKLPLEKFHRLLDLGFWSKFLKLSSISLFVFFGEFYRVSLDPVFFRRACGALRWRGRGAGPSLAAPPAHDQRSRNQY
jgi:hypothetical protein